MKRGLLIPIVPVLVLAVDPFSINLNNPQNLNMLTPQERAIVQNKQQILILSDKLRQLEKEFKNRKLIVETKLEEYGTQLQNLANQIQGLNSAMVEVTSAKLQISNNTQDIQGLQQRVTKLEQQMTQLQKQVTALEKSQQENFKVIKGTLRQVLKELSQLGGKVTPAGVVPNSEINLNLSPREAFRRAKKLFQQGDLEGAEKLFLVTYSKNYMPATTSYYLGEINFQKGKYKEAVAFYKESLTRYPKPLSFTSRMLYHLGVAFKKLGYTDKARLTFQKLIRRFHDQYATKGKEELKQL
ncbi:MAG: tetratricopeptide repeat protein [Campylobacterales bacterium]